MRVAHKAFCDSHQPRINYAMCTDWTNGDASDKLALIFTFDLKNIFNFEVNLLPKILSFVVLGIELVALIGSNMKAASTIRLFPRGCCQHCLLNFSIFAKKLGKLNAKLKAMDVEETVAKVQRVIDGGTMDELKDPKMLMAMARPALIRSLKPKIEPQLARWCLTWADVENALERIDTMEELQEALQDPMEFLKRLTAGAKPVAIRLMVSRIRPKLEPKLKEKEIDWDKQVVPLLQQFPTMEALKDAVEAAIMDPAGFAKDLADQIKESGAPKMVVISQLKPRLVNSYLKPVGLEWEDVLPAVQEVDTVDELKEAIADVDAFLEKLMSKLAPVAMKLAIARLKPKLEPQLVKHELQWADVLPTLELVDTIEEIKAAVANPDEFFEGLADAAGPAGKKLAIAKLRPKLKPYLVQYDLDWADLRPALEAVVDEVTPSTLKDAINNAEAFLEELASKFAEVAIKIAIAKMRPKLLPYLKKQHLDWSDVKPALEMIDTKEQVEGALKNPETFLADLLKQGEGAARKLVIAKIRPKMQPYLLEHELEWNDIQPVLDTIDTLQELEQAFKDVKGFLKKLTSAAGPAAEKLILAKLKRKLQPRLQSRGVMWVTVEQAVRVNIKNHPEVLDALRDALASPRKLEAFIEAHLSMVVPKAARTAIGMRAGVNAAAQLPRNVSFPNAPSLRPGRTRGVLGGSVSATAAPISTVSIDLAHVQASRMACSAAAAAASVSSASEAVNVDVVPPAELKVATDQAAEEGGSADKQKTFTFKAGPMGITLRELAGGAVKVTAVDSGSEADELGVVEGSVVLEVAGVSVNGMGKQAIISLVAQSTRPMTMTLLAPASPEPALISPVKTHSGNRESMSERAMSERAEKERPPSYRRRLSSSSLSPIASPRNLPTAPAADEVADASVAPPGEAPGKSMGTSSAIVRKKRHVPESARTVAVTFGPGPLGMGVGQRGDVVKVTSVDDGSQASAEGVVVGSVIIQVAGESVKGLRKREVLERVTDATRPVKLLLQVEANENPN